MQPLRLEYIWIIILVAWAVFLPQSEAKAISEFKGLMALGNLGAPTAFMNRKSIFSLCLWCNALNNSYCCQIGGNCCPRAATQATVTNPTTTTTATTATTTTRTVPPGDFLFACPFNRNLASCVLDRAHLLRERGLCLSLSPYRCFAEESIHFTRKTSCSTERPDCVHDFRRKKFLW